MKVENFVKTVQNVKEKNKLDLSAWEDLSIGLMNLVSLEEHAFFSYIKTQDKKFLEIWEIVRELRKKLLVLIVKNDKDDEIDVSLRLVKLTISPSVSSSPFLSF